MNEMSELHVFTNSADYYAALNIDEVIQMERKHWGENITERDEWYQEPDDKLFNVWIENEEVAEHGTGHLEEASFGHWIEELGKGWLFTTEF